MKGRKGFTLIELIMVIVILTIIAAVAIPRFIDLRTDARNATAKGIGGSVMGAISLLHSRYLLRTTDYTLGTTGGPVTGVLYNAQIQGVGITQTVVNATTGVVTATIGALYGSYTWVYTNRVGDEGARISETPQY